MGRLSYVSITSLDGYVADEAGRFDWSAPDHEVHAYVNDLTRPVGTYLYGRRMYEVMRYWESAGPDLPEVGREFATIWQDADKIVYSRTLESTSSSTASAGSPGTARTRIEREFRPEAVRELKAASDRELTVAGPELAAHAIRAGLVDELHRFISPVVVGGGHSFLPPGIRLDLELTDQRRFGSGVVYLRYRVRQG